MITAMPRIAIAVNDFESALSTFRNHFGMPVADFSPETVPSLGAHVAMCQPPGGSNIELMAPSNPNEPLSQALQKFLDRRGEGIYALMLEAPNPNAEAEVLLERGVKVLPLMRGAGGRDIHPSSTHGVLIRIYPDGSVTQPDNLVSGAPNYSGIQKVVVATRDATLARDVYCQGLGLPADPPRTDLDRGVVSSIVRPPEGGIIELLSPVDTSKETGAEIDEFLSSKGEGICALVLDADDDVLERDINIFGTRILIS
jgi:catechol 2,3-dioxygenase-like lactoylglutathione lyase family enzyme